MVLSEQILQLPFETKVTIQCVLADAGYQSIVIPMLLPDLSNQHLLPHGALPQLLPLHQVHTHSFVSGFDSPVCFSLVLSAASWI